jgi:ABC-type amino acid transport substrate-binding protein
VIAAALLHRLDFQQRRLLRFAAGTAVIVIAFVVATRALFGYVVPHVPQGIEALGGFQLRPPLAPATLAERARPSATPPLAGHRLAEINARGVMRVGYFRDAVPYAFRNAAGELLGLDIEMAHRLAVELGLSIEFVEIMRDDAAQMLSSGACDIVMSGFVVSLKRAEQMAMSQSYQQERLGFLTKDAQRARFASLTALEREPPRLGLQAIDDIAPLIRQQVPSATYRRYASIEELVAAIDRDVDAAVLQIDRAFYMSRIDPRLSAVLPMETTSSVMLSYAVPQGELEFRNVVDAWIDVKRAQGAYDSAKAYWVRGEGLAPRHPRWSIGRDVLGWWR